MIVMTSFLVHALLASPALLQEPEPQPQVEPETPQEPELDLPQEPEAEGPLSQEDAMAAVMEAIDAVRDSFMRSDRTWTEARTQADDLVVAPDDELRSEFQTKVQLGLTQSEQLVEQMETLLSLLPESDSQDQQQQQQQSSSNQSQESQPQDADGQEPNRDENGNPLDSAQMRENQSTNQPAPNDSDTPRLPMFLAPGRGGGSWGHLPPRLQETLQNSNAEDLPLRYRSLLEDYYRNQQGRDQQ